MLEIERITSLSIESAQYHRLIEFVERFVSRSKDEITRDDAITQIFADTPSRLWFIHEDEVFKGYMFAEFSDCLEGSFIAVHQLYMENLKDRTIYDRLQETLWDFSRQFGARKLMCSTRHNPHAFLRLLKNGWKIDSYLLSSTK